MLVRPEGRTLRLGLVELVGEAIVFQCSSAPKDGRYSAYSSDAEVFDTPTIVSMLVRPEGRTLPDLVLDPLAELRVSMLVRPEGRTLLARKARRSALSSFNARPPRRTDATFPTRVILIPSTSVVSMLVRPEGRTLHLRADPWPSDYAAKFQCSSAPKDGRYVCISCRDLLFRKCFNARPPRRTDATRERSQTLRSRVWFQCSSAPKDGRYVGALFGQRDLFQVSMLVRPEGRTLHLRKQHTQRVGRGFNARPPRRTDATGVLAGRQDRCEFQCSSAPKDGRYFWASWGWPITPSFNARPPRRTDATIEDQKFA